MPSSITTVKVLLATVLTLSCWQLSSGLLLSPQVTENPIMMSPATRALRPSAVARFSRSRLNFIGSMPPTSINRLFGSKAGTPGNPPGEIIIENVQEALPNLNEERLRTTILTIRDIIGYPTYDVTLYLVDDEIMQETNHDTRGVNKPTDILSFPFHSAISTGILQEPKFEGIPDYFSLGEMLIDVPYVIRACEEDRVSTSNVANEKNDDDDEYEWVHDDRGVSGAMATVYDPEQRINMLLIHGMLHLVGHDHEEDDEYELMVTKEEEILRKLGMIVNSSTATSTSITE